MRFETPGGEVAFEIPDEWWRFAEMDTFSSKGGRFYRYRPLGAADPPRWGTPSILRPLPSPAPGMSPETTAIWLYRLA